MSEYTLSQIAEIIGKPYETVKRHRWDGLLRATKRGREYKVTEYDMQCYIDEIAAKGNAEVIEIIVGLLDVIDKVIGEERMDAIPDTKIEAFQEVLEREIERLIK